jgi:hypothetical protein
MKVRVDISVFTEDEAVGMVSGKIEVPIVPQTGDIMSFDLEGADLVRHEAAFGMDQVKVTDRLISTGADSDIGVILSDITAKTKEGALQIMAFFEDCHGLFGDRWDEQDNQPDVKE